MSNSSLPPFPKASSISGRVLARLIEGQQITHRDILFDFATYRLSAPIHHLRKLKWLILDVWEEVLTKDPTGRKSRVKRYYLPESFLGDSKAEALDYAQKVRAWEAATSPSPKS